MSPRSAVPRHPREPKGFRELVEDTEPGDVWSTVCSQAPGQQGHTDTALTTHSTPGQQAWCSDPWRMCCSVLVSVGHSHLSNMATDLSGVSTFFPILQGLIPTHRRLFSLSCLGPAALHSQ